jgi:uncharacterized protein YhaN
VRIDGWHIDGYGVFHDARVGDLPAGLTIVTGPNESGKTTLVHFLLGMLFGFPNRGAPNRHDPLQGGTYGGRLFVTDHRGRSCTIARGAARASLELTGPDGPLPDGELPVLLGGAGEALYRSVFAVQLADLGTLRALSEDEVRDRVFSAGVVGAGQSAQQALRALAEARDALYKPGGRGTGYRLNRLRAELVDARVARDEARRAARGLPALDREVAELEELAGDLERRGVALRSEEALVQAVLDLWPTWQRARQARVELERLDASRVTPEAARLVELAPVVRALTAELAMVRERRDRRPALAGRVAAHRSGLDAALAALGRADDDGWLDTQPASVEDAAALRRSAEPVVAAAAALEQARARARQLDDALDQERVELRAAGARFASPPLDADAAADRARDLHALVDVLRRREQAEQRLVDARAAAARAEELPRAALDAGAARAASPAPWLAAIVAVAALAALVVAVLAAAGGAPGAAVGAAVLAVGLAVVAVVLRRATRPASRPEVLVPAEGVLDEAVVAAEAARAAVAAELDPLLDRLGVAEPPPPGTVRVWVERAEEDSRRARQDALDRRAHAERVEAQHLAATGRRSRVDADVAAAQASLADTRRTWQTWLARRGLPVGLDAAGAAEYLADLERARQLRALLQEAQADLRRDDDADADFATRVRDAVERLGPAIGVSVPDDADVTAVASRLGDLVGEAEAARRREEAIRADLEARIREARTAFAVAVGTAPDAVERARELLDEADPVSWRARLERLAVELAATTGERDEALRRHADAGRRRDELVSSADVPALELTVEDRTAQLAAAVRDWAALVQAHTVVEETLARYQRERQPRVVTRAAELFAAVTAGRYPRLEVRDREVVAVDEAGQEITAPALSQGAVEQLYLCMRVALAEAFAEVTPLPVLLDDCVVNADAERLPTLGAMIAAVAERHQVLVFTCHGWFVDELLAACPGAHLLRLPSSRRDVAAAARGR